MNATNLGPQCSKNSMADPQDDYILDRIQNDLARVISDLEVSVGINPEIIAKYRRLNDEVCYLPLASDVCSNEYMADALSSSRSSSAESSTNRRKSTSSEKR
jgi:hypothetical protein